MPRGKKTSLEDVYKVMVGYAGNKNVNDLAKSLGMPESTCRKIILDNQEKPEFVKLCKKKEKEFADKATRIIDKALMRLEKELDNEEKDIPINNLTTAIGTLYDKRALAKGESTQNQSIKITMDENVKELSK